MLSHQTPLKGDIHTYGKCLINRMTILHLTDDGEIYGS